MNSDRLARQIEACRAQYRLAAAWALLQILLAASAAVGALAVLADRLFCLGLDIPGLAAALASLDLLVLLAFLLWRRPPIGAVTYAVDRAAGLKNLVSSAASVRKQPDALAAALRDRAERALAAQRIRRLIPCRLHRAGRYLYLPLLGLAAVLALPQFDLLARRARRAQEALERLEVERSARTLKASLARIEERSEMLQSLEKTDVVLDFNSLARDLGALSKREALLKIGEFEGKYRDKLAEQREFERTAKGLSTSPDLQGMSADTRERLQDLMRHLNQGHAGGAGDALRDLAASLRDPGLSVEEKRALARELAKAVEPFRGGALSEELARLLREVAAAECDPGDWLRGCELAAAELEDLAAFCRQCEGLKALRDGLLAAKADMLGECFRDFDAREVERYLACEARLGGRGIGQGTGGEGRGRGGEPPEQETDADFAPVRSPAKLGRGRILHQLFVSGTPQKGEALAEYADVLQAARQHAASALAQDRIPREYESLVKTYFDSLEVTEAEEP